MEPASPPGPDRVSVALTGEVDYSVVAGIRQSVTAALDAAGDRVVEIDLSAVTFMDSSGLGLMVEAQNECRKRGSAIIITGATHNVRRTFALTGLDVLLAPEADSPI